MDASTVLTDSRYPGWQVVIPATYSEDDPDGITIRHPNGTVRHADMSALNGGTLVTPGTDSPIPTEWAATAMEIYLAQW